MELKRAAPAQRAAALVVCSLFCLLMALVARAGQKLPFNLPAMDFPSAISEFSQQAGIEILYGSAGTEDVAVIKTAAVVGNFEIAEALTRMLAGTGFTFEFEDGNEKSVLLRRKSAGGGSAFKGTGFNTAIALVDGKISQEFLPELIVTGSLIRGVMDLTSPLQIVTKKEMRSAAYATVPDVMQGLPVNFRASQNEVFGGTGNYARSSALNLRGLGTGGTLVLVNSQRQAASGLQGDFIDVSNIPWSMVESIEVLPDGSSALYGSDAIAGVVNIILRKEIEGAETQARFGTAQGGAAETLVAQTFGGHWSTGHWLGAYQYSHKTPLLATDRAYSANADKTSYGGRDFRSFRSNPGNILDPQTAAPLFAIPRGQDGSSLTVADLLPGVVNRQNRFEQFDLIPDSKRHGVFLTASQELGERFEVSGEARFGRNDFHYLSGSLPNERVLLVPATNPFFPSGLNGPFTMVAYDFTDDFGTYTGDGYTENITGAVKLKTNLGSEWQATGVGSYARESIHYIGLNQPNDKVLGELLANPDPQVAFNPFGDGSHTNPATIAAVRLTQNLRGASEVRSARVVADGPLATVSTGVAKLALGAEFRQEDLFRQILPGVFLSGSPQYYSRRISAAFGELSLPLIGDANNSKLSPHLELSLAGRYEKYSDFGDTFNHKLGLRWISHDWLKVRGSWGTSFKAPRLIDLYDKTQTLSGITVFPDPNSASGQSVVLVRQGSNPDLKEETATTWTMGVDIALPRLPAVSLTYYDIDYIDQVIRPGGDRLPEILFHEDEWARAIVRNPSRSQMDAICDSPEFISSVSQCKSTAFPVIIDIRLRNLARTKVNGLDFRIDQSVKTRAGQFDFEANANYLLNFQTAFTPTSPSIDIANTARNPLGLRAYGAVKWSQRGADSYGFGADLRAHYTGSYKDPQSTFHPHVDSLTTVDLSLSYRTQKENSIWGDMDVSLNAANLFDTSPPFVDWEWGFDFLNATPTGRVLSLNVRKMW